MMDTVHIFLDFKSSLCYLLVYGALHTIERDYKCKIKIWPFETMTSDLEGADRSSRIKYKLDSFEKYGKLLGIPMNGNVKGSTRNLLLGLLFMTENWPEKSLEYCRLAFAAFSEHDVDHEDMDIVLKLMRKVVPSSFDEAKFQAFMATQEDRKPLRYHHVVDSFSENKVFGVPCFVCGNGVMCYQPLSLSMIRFQLHQAGLQRSADILPDVSVAWRHPEPVIRPTTIGMPGTGPGLLSKYFANSANRDHKEQAGKVIDVYMDVKSPHAYLALEMIAALEMDFNVHINWLPFALDLARLYGDAKTEIRAKSKAPKPVSYTSNELSGDKPKRNSSQANIIKWAYKDIRRYASVRGITVFGTEKIWDSRNVLLAMLHCKSFGRDALDRFHSFVYPRIWARALNLEDRKELQDLVCEAGIPTADMWDNQVLEQKLNDILDVAYRKRNVFGVPTFSLDGEVFWGKEHLSLIRLRLKEAGLGFSEDCDVDIPHVWRPHFPTIKL